MLRFLLLTISLTSSQLFAQENAESPSPTEADYYKLLSFQIPSDVNLESGAIESLLSLIHI